MAVTQQFCQNCCPKDLSLANYSCLVNLHYTCRGDLLHALTLLDEEEDINKVLKYFSYEHFYVIYCKVSFHASSYAAVTMWQDRSCTCLFHTCLGECDVLHPCTSSVQHIHRIYTTCVCQWSCSCNTESMRAVLAHDMCF